MIVRLNLSHPLFVSSSDRDELTIKVLQPVLFQSYKDAATLKNDTDFTTLKALVPP